MDLTDRVAIVTGGSSGIGRGIALALADAGASLVVGDIRERPKPAVYADMETDRTTMEAIQEAGGTARFVETDVTDPAQCRALVEDSVETHGRLDVLVNNAGISVRENVLDLDVEAWHRAIDVNLSSAFYCSKFAMPHLLGSTGTVINIGSVQGVDGGGGTAYAAAKAGLINLTRELATEFGDEGVRANAICPGAVATANWNDLDQADVDAGREQTLLPRFGTPEDIGDAAVFLASDRAAWVTGEIFFVDGGWTAHR